MTLQCKSREGLAAEQTKKVKTSEGVFTFFILLSRNLYALWRPSSATVSYALPLARRAANTRRPLAVAILSRNPCLFLLFLCEGWNVLFIAYDVFCYYFCCFGIRTAKIAVFFELANC
jgi:hypothetical protein